MIIQFNEIPQEGQNYTLNQHTGELNSALGDLIGNRPFKVELDVLPLGQSFDVRGTVETKLPQVCSLCADEYTLDLKEKFHQIVMNEDKHTVSGFKENWSAEDVEVWMPKVAGQFDVGDMIHEVIGLAEPLRPICKTDCKGLCFQCGEELNLRQCDCSPVVAGQQKVETSPFSVLKELKVN